MEAHHGLARISWVDFVFPLFIFAMGVAIPLAGTRRLERGDSRGKVAANALLRSSLLIAFAFYNQHFRPYKLHNEPTRLDWWIGLLGMALVFPAFARLPDEWPRSVKVGLRVSSWVVATILILRLKYPAQMTIDPADIIILVLAGISTLGTLIWLSSRGKFDRRLFVMLGVIGLWMSASASRGWAYQIWTYKGFEWAFQPSFAKYLLILLPATLVGDWLVSEAPEEKIGPVAYRIGEWVPALTVGLILYGMFVSHDRPWWLAIPLGAVLLASLIESRVNKKLLQLGVTLCFFGLLLEPYQGGIKKDPATVSYLLLTAGLACFVFSSFRAWESRYSRSQALNVLALTGQNPLLAYEAITNLITPLWNLTVGGLLADYLPGPGWGLAKCAFETAIFVWIIGGFTKAKVFLRI